MKAREGSSVNPAAAVDRPGFTAHIRRVTARGHRFDIDGLRAVAVLAVVAYHVFERAVPAGFLGVDVFFVISGYLITQIIVADVEARRFSFAAFYARRVRRIYPALVVMILATLAASALLMLPDDFAATGASARWAALGASNLHFWGIENYFASSALRRPFLHTWSLGVEEQFYFVWPLLLAFALPLLARVRLPGWMLAAAVVVASLAWCWWIVPSDPYQLFYSPWSRAWELGLGALIAQLPALRPRWAAEAAGASGLVLVVAASLLGARAGLAAQVAASAGAAMIVWPKERDGWAAAALGLLPLRAIGLASYSLYLWHWPILVLYREYYRFGQTMSAWDYAICIAAIALVSGLSWAFIEQPFRRWRAPPIRPLLAGVVAATVVVTVGSIIAVNGLAFRFDDTVRSYLAVAAPTDDNPVSCFVTSRSGALDSFDAAECLHQDKVRPNVLVIGDSHSDQFIGALRRTFPEIAFSQASASGCLMLLHDSGESRCLELTDRVFSKWLDQYHFDAVILSARWQTRSTSAPIIATLDALKARGIRPIVLGPSQEYTEDLPVVLAYGLVRGVDLTRQTERNGGLRKADGRLTIDLAAWPGTYFSPLRVSCPIDHCRTLAPDGEPMLHDSNHLSEAGARFVIEELRRFGLLADVLDKVQTVAAQDLRPAL